MKQKFLDLESQLREQAPEQIQNAKDYAASITDPEASDADKCWRVIWDKPLFANARVSVAEQIVKEFEPLLSGAWITIGKPDSNFHLKKIGAHKKTADFELQGGLAERLKTKTASYRLYAIQGGAVALRHRAEAGRTAPYSGLSKLPVRTIVETIRAEMGLYWGHITVLHFLTDLGLACKPDIHLVRALERLLGRAVKISKIPTLDEAVAINQEVRNLAVELYGDAAPNRIRYLDKVLMEISRQLFLRQQGTEGSGQVAGS